MISINNPVMTNDDQHKLHNICGTSSVARKVSLIRRHVIVFYKHIIDAHSQHRHSVPVRGAPAEPATRPHAAGQQKNVSLPSPRARSRMSLDRGGVINVSRGGGEVL